MSREVDDRVISMQFDNSQFERNVGTSLSTIDKLKRALNFKGVTDGLEEIEAASHFSFDGLASSVQGIADKFVSLGSIGMNAINNITNRIIDMGIQTAKSMTAVEQMSAGWSKYADKTSSVQTIMAATRKEFGDVDNQMELVNAQLDKLNLFTDETSYSYLDMVNNIGKFTSNNVKLDTSVKAMEGIATWAAISGAGINGASHAMYNLSQSLAMGTVRLQDWRSIENANMATAEFKETALETAVALKQLTKVSDGVYKTAKGNKVTVESFSESLKDEWLTSKVLLETLDKYGGFSDALMEAMGELDNVTASEMMESIDKYKAGVLDLDEMAKQTGSTSERLDEIFKNLSKDEFELGRRAFLAAGEAKTFQEAIDSVKDAVSTGWMKTFEYLFGNYEQAKVLWTDLANTLYDIFAAPGEYRNQELKKWADAGEREKLIQSVKNIYSVLELLAGKFEEVFRQFFPQWTSETLITWTDTLYDLTKSFKSFFMGIEDGTWHFTKWQREASRAEAGERLLSLSNVLTRLMRGLRALVDIFKNLATALTPIWSIAMRLGGWFFDSVVDPLSKFIEYIAWFINQNNAFSGAFSKLSELLASVGNSIVDFLYKITDFVKPMDLARKAAYWLADAFGFLSDIFKGIVDLFNNDQGLGGMLKSFFEFSRNIASNLFKGIKGIFSGDFSTLGTIASKVFGTLTKIFEQLFSSLGKGEKGSIIDLINSGGFLLIVNKLTGFFGGLEDIPIIGGLFGGGGQEKGFFEDAKDGIAGLFESLSDGINKVMKSITKVIDVQTIKTLAISLALLAGSIWVLSSIDPKKLTMGLTAMYLLIEELVSALQRFDKNIILFETSAGTMGILLSMATSILILTAALKVLSNIEPERLVLSFIAVSVLIGEMVAVMKTLNATTDQVPKGMFGLISFAGAIWILAKAIKPIADINPERLWPSVAAISALILELFVVAALVDKNSGISVGAGIGLIAFAAAIRVLIPAVEAFGEMDDGKIMKGVIAVGALAGILAVFARITKGTAGSIFTGVGMIAVAASMLILYNAVKKFGDMDDASLSKGLATVAVSILSMGVALKLIGAEGILGAIAITVVAGAINLLVPAIEKLGNLSLEQIGKAALVLGGAFVILGGAAILLTPLAPTLLMLGAAMGLIAVSIAVAAAALTAFSGALNVFAGSLNILVQQITDIIVSLAFGIMKAAGAIAMAVTGVIIAIVSELGKGAGDIIAAVVQLLVNIIVALDTHLPTLITAALTFIAKFIFALADGIREYGPQLLLAVQNLVLSIGIFLLTALKSMVEQIPWVGGQAADAIDGVIGTIEGMMDETKAAAMGSDYMTSIGSGMETGANSAVPYIQSAGSIMKNATLENFDEIEGAAAESGASTIDTFATSMQNQAANMTGIQLGPDELNNLMGDSSVYQAAVQERTSTYLDGWTSPDALANATLATETFAGAGVTGIENKDQDFRQAGEGSATEVNNGFSSKNADFENAGALGAMGFINGLLSKVNDGSVYGAGSAIGNAALEAARKALEEHSPSRAMEQVGIYAGEGFVNGIKKTVATVASAATNLGTSAIDGLSNVISTISDLVDTDLNLNPVITPVFDTSNIAKGARKVNGLLANTPLVGVTADSATTNQNGGNTGGMTFIQNNYSPKELSRAELYRQTRNQFAAARGLVNGV